MLTWPFHLHSLNHKEPDTSVASLRLPPLLTSPKRMSPPLPSSSPDQETNGKLPRCLPYVSELQSNMKAPMPKPRVRKPSKEDTSSSYSSQAHPAEPERSVEASLVSPTRPMVRRRLGSKGASPNPHSTNRTDGGSQYPQDELLTSSPVCVPPRTPREADPAGGKSSSMQVQAPVLKAPPTPRRRPNKTVSESDLVQTSIASTSHHQLSLVRTRRKGGGIRVPLWKAPPPPIWTPPETPTSKDPNRKEK